MTAERDNEKASAAELLKQRYLKFTTACDEIKDSMDTKGATQEQYDVEFSTMADVEEQMALVLTIVRNKRKEYKRDINRAYQNKMEEKQRNREEARDEKVHQFILQHQQLFTTQMTQPLQQLLANLPVPVQQPAPPAIQAPLAPAVPPAVAIAAPQSTRLPRQIKHFKGDIFQCIQF